MKSKRVARKCAILFTATVACFVVWNVTVFILSKIEVIQKSPDHQPAFQVDKTVSDELGLGSDAFRMQTTGPSKFVLDHSGVKVIVTSVVGLDDAIRYPLQQSQDSLVEHHVQERLIQFGVPFRWLYGYRKTEWFRDSQLETMNGMAVGPYGEYPTKLMLRGAIWSFSVCAAVVITGSYVVDWTVLVAKHYYWWMRGRCARCGYPRFAAGKKLHACPECGVDHPGVHSQSEGGAQ